MRYMVELRNRSFELMDRLEDEVLDLRWSYSRIGGCGEFGFRLPRKLFEEKSVAGDFNIRVYTRASLTGTYSLVYQGLIENKTPAVEGHTETIGISGHGYSAQLPRIYISNGALAKTYVSQEVSIIVKSLLDNYITPDTDITYSASDIEVTSFTPDLIEFSTDAMSALQTLADLVGGREWGVDKNRNFFFKARSTTVGFKYHFGKELTSFDENQDFASIANRAIVQGAQSGGTYFFETFNDTASQIKYGVRSEVLQNSSIVTSAVASQFAEAFFDERGEVLRKATADLAVQEAVLEGTAPVPLVNVIKKGIRYGQKKYGTFLYAGIVGRVINRINYSISRAGSMNVSLDLGKPPSSLSEEIKKLEYSLEQNRTSGI